MYINKLSFSPDMRIILPPELRHILSWVLLNVIWIGIGIASLIPIPVDGSSNTIDWSKYFQITHESGKHFIRVERGIHYAADRYRDWTVYSQLVLLHYFVGNIPTRFDLFQSGKRKHLCLPFLVIPLFGLLGRVNGLQTSLNYNSVTDYGIESWIAYSLGALIWTFTIFLNLKIACVKNHLPYYLVGIFGLIVFYGVLYWRYFLGTEYYPYKAIHIHHWWIANLSCFLIHYDVPWNNVVYMVSYSIFIQGIVSFGAAPIFLEK